MRLAFISTILNYPWGGADVLWTCAAERAFADRHELLLAVSPAVAEHPRISRLAADGARIQTRSDPTACPGNRARLKQLWHRVTRNPTSLLVTLDRFDPEFIFLCQGGTYDFLSEPGLMEWLRLHRTPYALICQSNDEREHLSPAGLNIAPRIMAEARKVIFVSTHNRDLAFRQIGAGLANALVIANPLALANTSTLPLPWPASSPASFAVVARLEARDKGQDVLLEALAGLPTQVGWHVNFFGRGPDEAALRSQAATLGLGPRVDFRGFAPDVRSIWAEHHCLLLPSRREGCSLAMLEAMACGRPVLSTDVGGARDWISPGANGWICPSHDITNLRETIAHALAQFARWPSMGSASNNIIRQRPHHQPETLVLSVATDSPPCN